MLPCSEPPYDHAPARRRRSRRAFRPHAGAVAQRPCERARPLADRGRPARLVPPDAAETAAVPDPTAPHSLRFRLRRDDPRDPRRARRDRARGIRSMIAREPIYAALRSEEHTSELQSRRDLVCRLLLEKKKTRDISSTANGDPANVMYARHNPWPTSPPS